MPMCYIMVLMGGVFRRKWEIYLIQDILQKVQISNDSKPM